MLAACSVASDLLFPLFEIMGRKISVCHTISTKPPFVICHVVISLCHCFVLVILPSIAPRTLSGLKPEAHSPVSKIPRSQANKNSTQNVHMTQIINPRFRFPGASQPHGLNTFLGYSSNFFVVARFSSLSVSSLLTFLETCADTIFFRPPPTELAVH